MPELRQDPITKKWVIIATERSKRPSDFPIKHEERKGGACPFCKGNEKMTPPEIVSYREPDTRPDEPGWWIRVVPNKFAALGKEETTGSPEGDFFLSRPGIGAHEVIIESADHNASLEQHSIEQLQEIFRAWKERHDHLINEKPIQYVQIFKNEGAIAGASLEHPHSQIIATPLIPDVVNEEMELAQKYNHEEHKCIYCRINEIESHNQARVVSENNGFLAFCPFASRFPFEIWLVPKEHQSSFSDMGVSSLRDLSLIIKETIKKLTVSLNRPPYNMILHTAPAGFCEAPYYHWHLEILPRLTIVAGFEWGTGIYINPTPPEVAARYLREANT